MPPLKRSQVFKNPFSALLCGQPKAGKTFAIKKILENHLDYVPTQVYLAYTRAQDIYRQIAGNIPVVYMQSPYEFSIEDAVPDSLLIIDDLGVYYRKQCLVFHATVLDTS